MTLLVMKFGGAALDEDQSFNRVANLVEEQLLHHDHLVVVVSAMRGKTDELLTLAKSVHSDPPKREMDMLISVGERISMSLLAMALAKRGVEAISLTGSQSGILTSEEHTDAKILEVRPFRIEEAFSRCRVVIVAGFQGVSRSKEITTLGRGGSDTTAVALAIALKAEKVEFYKDVNGIFSKDPKHHPEAVHIPYLSYERALEISEKGRIKILHPRAIQLAEKNDVSLHIRSFSKCNKGISIVSRVRSNCS